MVKLLRVKVRVSKWLGLGLRLEYVRFKVKVRYDFLVVN